MKYKRLIKRLLWTLFIFFLLMNVVAFFHAYNFTHFKESGLEKTKSPEKLSTFNKIKALFVGVSNPRPKNKRTPADFEVVKLRSNKQIECWYHKTEQSLGTVIIFHGYGGEKSSMLDKAREFNQWGYNTFLIDFMGSGGSEGNRTTIGFREAEQVKSAYDYIGKGEQNIILFGTSMGSVAIMKALNDNHLQPSGIIIECPFGSMYQTVGARFRKMNVPAFPMAGLLVFWGGIQNGYWAFDHNPAEYAKNIECRTLLLYGERDKSVSRKEINDIYTNLKGRKTLKTLKTYKLAGHENYLLRCKEEWRKDVSEFLKDLSHNIK